MSEDSQLWQQLEVCGSQKCSIQHLERHMHMI